MVVSILLARMPRSQLQPVPGPRVLALALAAGLVTVWAYFGPWPLVMVGATMLALAFRHARSDRLAVGVALLFGLGYFAILDQPFAAYSPRGTLVLIPLRILTLVPVGLALRWLHQRWRWPLAIAFPLAWVGGEFLRMQGPLAMPSGALALPLTELGWLLQLAELGGSYAISVVAGIGCGLMADAIRLRQSRAPGVSVRLGALVALVAVTFSYGTWRQREVGRAQRPGPVLAVIQPDVPMDSRTGEGFDPDLLMHDLRALSEAAVRHDPRPDLVLWAEAPAGFPVINAEWPGGAAARREFEGWVQRLGVPVLYGSNVLLPGEAGRTNDWKIFNAVTRYDPGATHESGRQFKRRLFPGGETMPGANLPWLGGLMDWLGGGRSSSRADWLTPGTQAHVFTVTNAPQVWRHRVVICSEALFPEDTGSFLASTAGKPVDFVTVPGNLGGFARNRAQRWYFASLRVRAAEARIGLACSLNTGISGFVRPDGSVHGLVTNASGLPWTGRGAPELKPMAELLDLRLRREAELATNGVLRAEVQQRIAEINRLRAEAGVSGYSVDRVWTHPGITPYSRTGDVLGGSLCLAMGLAAVAELAWSARSHFRLSSPRRSA